MICPVCGTENPAAARFCMQCGTALTGVATLGVAATRAAAARQAATAAHAEAESAGPPQTGTVGAAADLPSRTDGVSPAERRVVSVLFADLTNSTQLADTMDPEDLRTLLTMFFARMTHEVHRHGGTVEKYVGDAIMAVFGLPIAHEDDPVRAVRAALGMRTALRQFNAELHPNGSATEGLHMRIGINTGEVVAATGAAAGDGRDFLITGDAVNVAARLQQVSEADSILVGPRTYRGSHGAVVYRGLPPVQIRGKPRPFRVWEVVALAEGAEVPLGRPRGMDGLRAPLVGRDTELALLRQVYAQTFEEHRVCRVTVVGMPGIGKTRLIREYINRLIGISSVAGPDVLPTVSAAMDAEPAGGPLVLEGRCPPYGEGITYWPLAEMVREWCDLSALDAPEYARDQLLGCVTAALSRAGRAYDPAVIAAYLGHTIGIETRERRQALLPSDARQLHEGLQRAWRDVFGALASVRPLVLVFDDIHWADDALLDLLDTLVERLRGVAVLLICQGRPELFDRRPEQMGPGESTIMLESLSDQQSASLLNAQLPSEQIPGSLRRGILAKAGGNPFYLEEIVRMLADRGIIIHESGGAPTTREPAAPAEGNTSSSRWSIAPEWMDSSELRDPVIPDTVQGVLAARLDLLPSGERAVVQHAAVIGRYFWASVLRVLAPDASNEALDGVLERLAHRDMIQESNEDIALTAAGEQIYTFKHVLTREVTYGAIPRTRRAQEHALLAQWLETQVTGSEEALIELTAFHYQQYYLQSDLIHARNDQQRQTVRAKVLQYLTLAGDNAAARHAASKAERYFSDVLDLLADDADPADIGPRVHALTQRGTMRWLQSRGDEAWGDYHNALEVWEHANEAAERDGAVREALPADWNLRGLRLYRLLVQLPTRSGSWFIHLPDHQALWEYLQRGLALADALGQRDTLDGAGLLTAKSFLWWSWAERRGEQELLAALRSAREAVSITEALRAPREASEALDALGNIQATTADLRGHLESQTRRLYYARQIDDVNELVDIHAEVSSAYQVVGEYELAVAHADEARELANATDAFAPRAQALQADVLAYFEWDRWPEAIEAGEQLLAATRLSPIEHAHHHQRALLALAIAYARTGRMADAEPIIALTGMARQAPEVLYLSLFRARFALAHGAYKEAERLMLAGRDNRSGRYALPFLLSELVQLGTRPDQRELFDRFGAQALELGWRSGARKALAQALRARGMVSLAEGQLEDALADLSNALTRYRSLATRWEETRTRVMLASLARHRKEYRRARTDLARALEEFELLHAAGDIVRTRAALAGAEARLG